MSEFYCFPDQTAAQACVDAINASGWFPIIGNKNGVPNPSAQHTVAWVDGPTQMLSGEWSIPRIPTAQLDFLGVPQAQRDSFIAMFGQDIRTLTHVDFPAPPAEE